MYFEKLTDAQIEGFVGSKMCLNILNLGVTSLGQSNDNLHLIRTLNNGKIVRHYCNDIVWYNCEKGVDNVTDLSRKWQGYVMHCLESFEDKKNYANYLKSYYKSDKKTKNKAEDILCEVFKIADSFGKNALVECYEV